MLWFLIGLVVGGSLGIVIMAVLSGIRDSEIQEVSKIKISSYDSPSVN